VKRDCASGNRANARFGGGDTKGCAANRFCDANARLQQSQAAREPIAALVMGLVLALVIACLLGLALLRGLGRCGRSPWLCPVQRLLERSAVAERSRLKSALTTFQGASNPDAHMTILFLIKRKMLLWLLGKVSLWPD
jgi:hypothetical protein